MINRCDLQEEPTSCIDSQWDTKRNMSANDMMVVERGTWDETANKPDYSWDAFTRQCVRVTVHRPVSMVCLIRCGVLRYHFADGVCRVWACARLRSARTYFVVNHRIMRPAGFFRARELDVSTMPLLEAATAVVSCGLGRGLPNWTKRMSVVEFSKWRDDIVCTTDARLDACAIDDDPAVDANVRSTSSA